MKASKYVASVISLAGFLSYPSVLTSQELSFGDWHHSGPSTEVCEASVFSNDMDYQFKYVSEFGGKQVMVMVLSRQKQFGPEGTSVRGSLQFSDGTWNDIGEFHVGLKSEIGQLLVLKKPVAIHGGKIMGTQFMRLHIDGSFIATFSLNGSTKAMNAFFKCAVM